MDKTDDFLGIFSLLYYTLILRLRHVNPNVSVGIFTAISCLQSKFPIPLRLSSHDKVKIINPVLFSATTYYVDATNGKDANNGLSQATPGKPSPKSMPEDFTLGIRFCLKGEKEGLRLNLSPLTKSQKTYSRIQI